MTNSKVKNQMPPASPVIILLLFATRSQQNAIFSKSQIATKKKHVLYSAKANERALCYKFINTALNRWEAELISSAPLTW